MLHPDALKILEWFVANHPNFDLLSNCLQPEKLIQGVKKHPPRHLYISLDGDADTYLYMRGKAGYGSVIRVIEELKDLLPISVMFTLSPYNDFSDMEHVAKICKSYNIDMRVGIYNDIAFFDTVDKAHETEIGVKKFTSFEIQQCQRDDRCRFVSEKQRKKAGRNLRRTISSQT